MNNKVHVKTDDIVIILSGKERGKQGKVLVINPKEGEVIVEGRSMVTKYVKPHKMDILDGPAKIEDAPYACKVQIACPHCEKPIRVAHKLYEDGTKNRVYVKCNGLL